jgi:hypothetical protein
MSGVPVPARELRCPSCGGRGAYARATTCTACDTALVSVPVDDVGAPEPVFVYRPWVMVVLAVCAVGLPFLPFLDGVAGLVLKLSASAAIVKIMRDYRETMRS